MLEIRKLCCGYGGAPVVQDADLTAAAGECVCLLGPNGCGKTTLLRAVAGILPCRGQVTVDGVDLRGLDSRARARRVALMSQLAPAAFDYTVYETVLLGRYAHQRSGLPGAGAEDARLVRESLERCGLWALRERSVTALSGGQLQRVFLARAFAQDPQVLLLDEPTNHLDLRCQVELVAAARAWAAQGGRCIVGVLHDVNLALSLADSVVLMEAGRLAAKTPAGELDQARLNALYGMDVGAYMRRSLQRWAQQ